MPVTYSVKNNGLFVHALATEPLTTEHVCEFQDALWQDDRVKPGYTILFDESKILESRIDAQGLATIVEREKSEQAKRPAKLAIVAGPGSAFPRALEYEKLISPGTERVIVFHNKEIAMHWLGVPDE
jgi:hypothetical protein